MSRALHLIVVGKLKDGALETIETDYLKRITNPDLIIHEVRASAENKQAEGEALLKKIKEIANGGACQVVALSEWGKRFTSVKFSEWLNQLLERSPRTIFLIAGAEGFSEEVLRSCNDKLSLSELTFPHKIARILLCEQLYRAQTIRTGHPYHN